MLMLQVNFLMQTTKRLNEVIEETVNVIYEHKHQETESLDEE